MELYQVAVKNEELVVFTNTTEAESFEIAIQDTIQYVGGKYTTVEVYDAYDESCDAKPLFVSKFSET